MSKLNKAQTLELVVNSVTHLINTNRGLFKKDKDFEFESKISRLLSELIGPKSGGGTSTKVNEAGEVYCNYFKEYFKAEYFNTKLSKPNKETGERHEMYKANSLVAEQILRKIKSLKAMVTRQVTLNFMDKTIDADEMQTILSDLDRAERQRYIAPEDVPTVADIVGLTAPVTPADLPEEDDLMALADEIEATE